MPTHHKVLEIKTAQNVQLKENVAGERGGDIRR